MRPKSRCLYQQASVKQTNKFTHPRKNSYRHMLHSVIPQEPLNHPLRGESLLAGCFRCAQIADRVDEMPDGTFETALRQRCRPGWQRLFQQTLRFFP